MTGRSCCSETAATVVWSKEAKGWAASMMRRMSCVEQNSIMAS
ncbi:hypothetical protein GGR15_001442 [Butyricimonas paravirosa]|uniref:Uncharacterized protein n=1 Tax=Butyricimonas paravirosa TaxID=1472417 RepID=A0A7X5YB41_9BACT|nr:hypothetical protein [Butyricimonas paravirosa]